MAGNSDFGGLFANAQAPPSPTGTAATRSGPASAERRQKLFNYDAAAAQALNPYGPSEFSKIGTEEVWKMVSKGSISQRVRGRGQVSRGRRFEPHCRDAFGRDQDAGR